MDPAASKASDLERRASTRASTRVSLQGEEDDYDYAAATIADGFGPTRHPSLRLEFGSTAQPTTQNRSATAAPTSASPPARARTSTSTTESTTLTPTPSPAHTYASSSASASTSAGMDEDDDPANPFADSPPRPSSIAKHTGQTTAYSSRHDEGMDSIREAGSTRASSTTTDSNPFISAESPYQGPSNPSHPYQMYPQNVRVARTLSVTTSSTTPASEASYAGPRGPTHPYAMYPQATISESSTAAHAGGIPVGFPGIPDNYHRRIGPEGEDIADMIGPDGHTEQLPPYTRYPDEPYNKMVAVGQPANSNRTGTGTGTGAGTGGGAAASVSPPSNSLAVPASIPGAGGLGLATRDPEFEADDLDSPRSRQSRRSFNSDISHHAINSAAADTTISEKEKRPPRNCLWARRRLGGVIPYWAICLAVIAILLLGAILGSVVGTFLARHSNSDDESDNSDQGPMPSVTITYDATPIPTPANLPALATGTYAMPLMSNSISSECFNDTEQSKAWNCDLVIFSGLSLTIQSNLQTPGPVDYTFSLTCNESLTLANNVYSYGQQPPLFFDPLPLELVNDTYQPSRGPAWFRMTPYNKTVILPEKGLQPTTGATTATLDSRDIQSLGSGGDLKRKTIAQTGDRPWICTWPDTLLEIFIYPLQNSSWSRPPTTSLPSDPSSTITKAPTATTTTTTRGNPFNGNGRFPPISDPNGPDTDDTYTSTTTSTSTSIPLNDPIDTSLPEIPPSPYPRVVKMEERRVKNSPMPVCRQVQIQSDGLPALPVMDDDGNEVVVYIVENEVDHSSSKLKPSLSKKDQFDTSPLRYRDGNPDLSDCGCMWFLT